MSIFVDPLINYGWKLGPSCHMFTDGDIEELHVFAESIGMKRSWFQVTTIPHYDLVKSRRVKAVAKGAIEISLREMGDRVSTARKLKLNTTKQQDNG